MKTFLCIGDTHFPFTRESTLYGRNGQGGIVKIAKELQPDYIIQMGDLYDMFSWSKYPFKRDVYTPEAEIGIGKEMAQTMWKRLKGVSRRSKCYQLMGNHDERMYKRLLEKNPEFASFYPGIRDQLFAFPGVKSHASDREELIVGDIVFMHGYRSKLGEHCKHNNMSTVCGHSHVGGCIYLRRGSETIWELNCGFVGDSSSVPLSYTNQKRFSRWTQGVGVIDKYGPRFIPLPNE